MTLKPHVNNEEIGRGGKEGRWEVSLLNFSINLKPLQKT